MKKVKRISIVMLCVMMLISSLYIAPVSAIEFQGTTTTVFDQDFGGLNTMPSGFTKTGTWTFAGKYAVALGTNNASIMTASAYDLTDTNGYVFKVGAAYTFNGFIMYLGWDESAGTGYQLAMYGNKLYLYKNGAFSTSEKENSQYCVATSATYPGSNAYYNLRRYYTVNVTKTGVSVSSDRDANMLTYTVPEGESAPEMKGKFGVKSQYTSDFGVWNMSLESIDSKISVDRWMIDKTFTASDTVEGVNAEGFVFEKTPAFTSDGAVVGSANPLTYDYTALSGDYVVETSVYKQYNANYIKFNYTDASNYYEFKYKAKGGYTLTKYAGGEPYVLAEGADGSSYVSAGNVTNYVLRVENDDTTGDLKMKVTLSRSPYTVEATDYYDDADETVPNGAPITSGKVMLDFDTTGDATYIKNFKAYSIVPEEEQGKTITFEKNVFEMATPKVTDTSETLSNQGITTNGSLVFADGYAEIGAGAYFYINNDELKIADSYSFKVKSWREYSDHDVRFNYSSDGKSYYQIKTYNGYSTSYSGQIAFNKVVNGSVADTKTFTYTNPNSFAPNSTTHIHDVTVKKDADGKLNITAYVTGKNGALAETITYTDETPLDPGRLVLYNARRLYSVSVNTYVSQREENLLTMATPKATDDVSTLAAQGITTSSTFTMNDGYASIPDAAAMIYIRNDELEMADSYSFKIKSFRQYSNHDVRFNRSSDGKNYYQIRVYNGYGSSTGIIEFNKVVGGSVADTKNFSYSAQAFAPNNATHIHDVTVKKEADGTLNITAYVTGNNGAVSEVTYTDASPLDPGHIALYNSLRLYSAEVDAVIVESDTYGEVPLYKGRFLNGSNALMSMVKGDIYFSYPTKLLGDYTVVACLYDDNQIQDIKVLDELDIYKEKVRLFDTTSVSNDAFIKVYFIDSLGKLNYLTDVYTLN